MPSIAGGLSAAAPGENWMSILRFYPATLQTLPGLGQDETHRRAPNKTQYLAIKTLQFTSYECMPITIRHKCTTVGKKQNSKSARSGGTQACLQLETQHDDTSGITWVPKDMHRFKSFAGLGRATNAQMQLRKGWTRTYLKGLGPLGLCYFPTPNW
ncbi:hypothetical protein Y1Q_0023840 [Alligator mississippiensis]|uniref:Uncharacterized protein n=1 Tax=Alligator mississippiensis TaxID=8496 RepID=A0A151MKE2_ALLMI|nr:hypothetical protein Y1Q_0023840 [Alligator mississippiensis]